MRIVNEVPDQVNPPEYPLSIVKEVLDHAQLRVRRERQVRQIKAALRRLGILSAAGSGWVSIDDDNNLDFGQIPDDRITLFIFALADVDDARGRTSSKNDEPGPDQTQLPGLEQSKVLDVSPILVPDNDGRHLGGTQ